MGLPSGKRPKPTNNVNAELIASAIWDEPTKKHSLLGSKIREKKTHCETCGAPLIGDAVCSYCGVMIF